MKLLTAHFLLCVFIAMHSGMAAGKETGQPVPSCDKCSQGIERVMSAIEKPDNLADRSTLEKIFEKAFTKIKTKRLNGGDADLYTLISPGPPRTIINWTLNSPGDFVVIFSLNSPYMPPNTLGNMDNCAHPSYFKNFENLGWHPLGIEDTPTHYAEYYEKDEYRLQLSYSARYRCLSSLIVSKK